VVVEEVKNKLNDVIIVELIVVYKEKLVEFVDVEDKLVLKISVNNDALIIVAVNVVVSNEGVRKVMGMYLNSLLLGQKKLCIVLLIMTYY
jgi:hypothetical protein